MNKSLYEYSAAFGHCVIIRKGEESYFIHFEYEPLFGWTFTKVNNARYIDNSVEYLRTL